MRKADKRGKQERKRQRNRKTLAIKEAILTAACCIHQLCQEPTALLGDSHTEKIMSQEEKSERGKTAREKGLSRLPRANGMPGAHSCHICGH